MDEFLNVYWYFASRYYYDTILYSAEWEKKDKYMDEFLNIYWYFASRDYYYITLYSAEWGKKE